MATTELLVISPKKGSDIDIKKPLHSWISATFGSTDDPVDASADLTELQNLRQAAVRPTDKGEGALNASADYYDQVAALECKVPSNEVQIPFKWKDAFDRGSIFGGRMSLSIPTLSFDKVCILFNVAAFSSSVAAEQSFTSDEGLLKALKKLQMAAGIFHYLKENVVGMLQRHPTPDLDPETLATLSELMLAQAQEVVVIKAMKDKMKNNVVAKLASQCEDMFANVMRNIQKETVRNLWDADWLPNVSGKQAIYNGLAQFHQSRMCNDEKLIGEEIARLKYAQRLFAAGVERGTHSNMCDAKEWLKRSQNLLDAANKDNDFIYHERIPEEKTLNPIGKALMAKVTPFTSETRVGSTDKQILFQKLVPVAVHQAMAAYDVRKREIVGREINKLQESTNLINASLASMNLPAALEDTSGSEIPQSLKDKSEAVVNAGGHQAIKKLLAELPDLLTRNTEILDECDRMLKEESESDKQLRDQFKDKWTRTSSDKLTGTFLSNSKKYRSIIDNATKADTVVRDKFDSHVEGIEMLAKGSSCMDLPESGPGGTGVKAGPIVAKLKKLCEDVEAMKAEREVIESELKSTNPNMRSVFLTAYGKDGSISEQTISNESLTRVFGPLEKQASESVTRQGKLLNDIMEANSDFVKERGSQSGSAREDMLKKLAAAHNAYFELRHNLEEGTKFYNDLTQLLVTFQSKVSDFTYARKTEKEELLKDLTTGLSQMSLAAAPAAPAHHANAPDSSPSRPPRSKDAPPRPPPPNTAASAPTAAPANPYAGAPAPPQNAEQPAAPTQPNPYAGAPAQPYPYAAAPAGANPYGGQPYPAYLPYPAQPAMPMPPYQQGYAAPMPAGYSQFAGYPQQNYYPAQQAYPPPPQQQAYPPQQQQPYPPAQPPTQPWGK